MTLRSYTSVASLHRAPARAGLVYSDGTQQPILLRFDGNSFPPKHALNIQSAMFVSAAGQYQLEVAPKTSQGLKQLP